MCANIVDYMYLNIEPMKSSIRVVVVKDPVNKEMAKQTVNVFFSGS